MAKKHTLYILDIKIPDEDSQRIPVQGKITVGSASDVDICIEEFGLAPRHCIFRDNNEVLTVQNTAGDGGIIVGKQELNHGKMYIVDKGDSIKIGDLTFVIRTEKVDGQFVDDQGETLTDTYVDEMDEEEAKTSSFISRISSLFKRNKAENLTEPEKEEIDKVQIIDHSAEEVEEDDDEVDEDEDTAPNREFPSGALGKIEPKKVRVSPYIVARRAGFIVRLLGLIINLAVVYSIYLYALPLLKIEAYFQKGFDLLTPFIEKGMPLLSPHVPESILTFLSSYTFLKILSLYLAVEIIAALIFGCSIGLFLLGATGHGGFLSKRIKALVRTLIGFITSPLLIFDAPVLLRIRSLKEVLSFSQIEKRSNFLSLFLGFTIFPVVLIATIIWPLVADPILLKNPEFLEAKSAVRKKGKREANFISLCAYFKIKTKFYKKDSLEFIPSIERGGPTLHLIDLKKGDKVSLSKLKEIDLNPEFQKMVELNPFFSSFTPHLYKFMNEQEDSHEITREIADLQKDALGITPMRLHQILLDHGPYLNGLMSLRMKILKELGIVQKFKTTFFNAGRKDYLAIEESGDTPNKSIYILPIGAMKIEPIKIHFNKKTGNLAQTFLLNFFKTSGTFPQEFTYDASAVEQWNALSLIDFFAFAKDKEAPLSAQKGILEFYQSKIEILKSPKDLSARSKKAYEKLLKDSFNRTSKALGESKLATELLKLTEQLPDYNKEAK
ncbi:MAG: hypothetical protein ACJAT2_003182 [Bacteriovoracaceae bacterium]